MTKQSQILETQLKTINSSSVAVGYEARSASVELPDFSSDRVDPISQLRSNLAQLENMQMKLNFMLNELSGLVRKP
ncbi:MAG: hypothetical protein CL675_09745 [Bdellovibrionaceae bacterium]|nr:hypothetical protein [Pseudobdellovibrionaceae bacterium]